MTAPFREAPLALNFPLHLSHLGSTAELLETDPAIVHYHDRVASDGLLLPTPYPCAQRRVEQLNQRIVAWSASRGNGRALPLARNRIAALPSTGDDLSTRRSSCVLIVGMHRGGTSAVAQTIARLDVPFGTASDRMPPLPENPTGYWESTVLSLFNEDLLEALGGSWSAPPPLAPGWQRDASLDHKRELGKALLQSVHLGRRWAWKDPRNSLLLPFWQEALGLPLRIVLVHRNPLEIWRSLAARGGFTKPLAMALWERYTRSALEAARGLPTLIISYEGLLEHFRPWEEALRCFLGCEAAPELEDPHHSLLDKSLRHSAFRAEDVAEDPVFSGEQRRLFAIVEELLGTHEPLRIPELHAETPSTKRLFEERLTMERAATEQPHESSAHPLALEGIQESVELDDLAQRSAYRSYLAAQRTSEERNQARLRVEVAGCATDMRISLLVGLHRPNAFRLDRALRSVRSQILSSWQLCLCDDGENDDDTKTLLAGFARDDDRILLSRHERARGASAAWRAFR